MAESSYAAHQGQKSSWKVLLQDQDRLCTHVQGQREHRTAVGNSLLNNESGGRQGRARSLCSSPVAQIMLTCVAVNLTRLPMCRVRLQQQRDTCMHVSRISSLRMS